MFVIIFITLGVFFSVLARNYILLRITRATVNQFTSNFQSALNTFDLVNGWKKIGKVYIGGASEGLSQDLF